MSEQMVVVNVILDDREDGGLRVFSDDMPGLVLSGREKTHVMSAIAPAIKSLFEYDGVRVRSVTAAVRPHELLEKDHPADGQVEARCEHYVVQVEKAAA